MTNIFTLFKGTRRLKGMPVFCVERGERLGTVREALLHPTEGRLAGIVVRTSPAGTRVVPEGEFFVGRDAVMVTGSESFGRRELRNLLLSRFDSVEGINGTDLLTSDGTLLGTVRDVYVESRGPRVVYRVAKGLWQRLFGGGIFVPGLVASVYSPDRRRLVAPVGTLQRFGSATPREAFASWPDAA